MGKQRLEGKSPGVQAGWQVEPHTHSASLVLFWRVVVGPPDTPTPMPQLPLVHTPVDLPRGETGSST